MVWKLDNPECHESQKIKWELVPYTKGLGLDLGCGPAKAYQHFIGVDNRADTGLFGIQMNPDLTVPTCEKLPMFAARSMDFVFSSHLLEHIQDYKGALAEWWRLIKVGGYLCLYLPHKDYYPNIGKEGANPDHKHDFLPSDITAAMKDLVKFGGWDLVENQERNEEQEYSFFQVYKKLNGDKFRQSWQTPKPQKTCAVIRYGAFGDLLMTSNLLPQLKAEGYHITMYSVPRGFEVVKHDPHIDAVILQDQDQVPNHELGQFWAAIAKKYDKVVNLSESVEGTLLALKGRIQADWPHALRHEMLDKNYLEFAHKLAGLPFEFHQKFYSTGEEKAWAKKERQKIGGSPVILWSLAGSSVHKTWPHLDAIIARMMLRFPDCRVILTGDEACQMLEAGWENEKRVVCKSGKWTIRETLSMLEQADLVIGPETGVLNAAAGMSVPKIVTLSHSSPENLTKHWLNTTALTPENTACYPCHMMHYGWERCHRGPVTGVALCQENIGVEAMWDAVCQSLNVEMKKAA